MENTEQDEENNWNCQLHPSVFFLLGTLILTACSTCMLCAAIMTDHWEEVTWDHTQLDLFIKNQTLAKLKWILDGIVGKLTNQTFNYNLQTKQQDVNEKLLAFLVPMHGGIWTLCLTLTDDEISLLNRVDFPQVQPCVNYLSGGSDGVRGYEPRTDWQHRMQNLSISCALVCLIILGSAALVGAFGLCQHQISAVLVTGVMYLLAASFALFTLTIIHFKRLHNKPRHTIVVDADYNNGGTTIDGIVNPYGAQIYGINQLLQARIVTTSWSFDLGWGGVVLCVMTSILWILLSKIMRFNPISTMIN